MATCCSVVISSFFLLIIVNLGFCFFTYLIIFIVFRNFWILHRIGCALCLLLLEVVEFHSHRCFQHLALSSVPWSLSSVLSYDDLFLSWFLVSNSTGFIIFSGLSQEARSLYLIWTWTSTISQALGGWRSPSGLTAVPSCWFSRGPHMLGFGISQRFEGSLCAHLWFLPYL